MVWNTQQSMVLCKLINNKEERAKKLREIKNNAINETNY